MHSPETARAATADTVNGLRDTEQLANQLTSETTVPALKAQGTTLKLHIILMARWVADLARLVGPR